MQPPFNCPKQFVAASRQSAAILIFQMAAFCRKPLRGYFHSIVPGGLLVRPKTARMGDEPVSIVAGSGCWLMRTEADTP